MNDKRHFLNPRKKLHSGRFVWRQAMQRWPLCRFAVSRGPQALVQRTAVTIDYLLIRFRENVGNGYLPLKDARHS